MYLNIVNVNSYNNPSTTTSEEDLHTRRNLSIEKLHLK